MSVSTSFVLAFLGDMNVWGFLHFQDMMIISTGPTFQGIRYEGSLYHLSFNICIFA